MRILRNIREDEDRTFGILSSHPAAIMATLRAFGRGIENFDFSFAKLHGRGLMASSPVMYVKTATLKGTAFSNERKTEDEQSVREDCICCAFTDFWVDHKEPLEALRSVEEEGVHWPLGKLPEGCEFLVLFEGFAT
ncbi:hypothetical protein K504DRAFT_500317 [Pleomassaria siparia CBS 279.74]|uniref:Uncharacterized protein n=1 Tax=Pleomassaria siparia CBS 279.74 TaxID=1314801 RepID=A0A6G1KGQ6_9PLEO|nr:hypothetical protein K504DRAFT_500317 [Pleomassaria siparia CBS 279.74]